MERMTYRKYQTSLVRRYIILGMMIVLGYLSEVCIMPYIRIFGVTPNLLYVLIGIITVAYGKLRALWAGLIYGLLMEIMLQSVPYLNLMLYPVTTLFCSFAFADKPLKTIEYERAVNKKRKELPPWLRTVLCTALNTFIFEVVNVTYIYLGGSPLQFSHFFKAIMDVILTSALCFLLLFPLRRLILGPKFEMMSVRKPSFVFNRN